MSQQASAAKRAQQREVQPRQLGQDVFKTILSEDCRLETVPSVPTFRPAGRRRGSALGAWPLHNQGQAPHGEKLMPQVTKLCETASGREEWAR